MLNIKLSLNKYTPHTPIKRGRMELKIQGNDIYNEFINSLGRIITKRIPKYAFPPELIQIEKIDPDSEFYQSVAFNNDMMKLRISNIPVMFIDPECFFLHESFWMNVDFLDQNRKKHDNEKRIEAFIDVKNKKKEILNVTTNDMKIFIDDKLNKIYNEEYPLLLISLKPNEAFKCSLKAVLSIGLRNSIWNSCSNFWFYETDENSYLFFFESSSSFNEFSLMKKGLKYFKKRTSQIKNEIKRMYTNEKKFSLIIKNEDHTMGEVINYEFQSHPDILKSSHTKTDHLIFEANISVIVHDNKNLLNAMIESLDTLIKKIDFFEKEFLKIDSNVDFGLYNNTLT